MPSKPTNRTAARKPNLKTASTGSTPDGDTSLKAASTATITNTPENTPGQPPEPPKRKQLGKTKAELKERARTIIQALVDGYGEKQALKKAGYSDTLVNSGAKRDILRNSTIQSGFTAYLERAGVTDDKIAAKISSLMDATTLKRFGKENIQIDDNATQANMVQFAAKLKGYVVDRSASLNLNVDASPADLSGLVNRGKTVDNCHSSTTLAEKSNIIDIE